MITTQSDIIGQAMSGKEAGSEDVIQKAGIDMVLNKPFEAADLRSAIARLLKR